MKVVKIVGAILACLFVVSHLIEIPQKIGAISGDLAVSWWIGKLVGILIGSAIAIALFKSAARKPKS